MTDITMCSGKGCPMKNDCYRHTAKANEYRQAYFVDVPVVWQDKGDREFAVCEHFLEQCRI